MFRPPVRAITLGVAEPHPLPARVVERAGWLLRRAATAYQDAGYEVQTVRLSTRPVFDDLADRPLGELVKYAHGLQEVLDATGLRFCSLGTAQAARPGFPLPRVEAIADLLIGADALSATVQLATPKQASPPAAGLAVAQVMRRLAAETEEGFGNFRFAALACVPAGTPFFPAAYHEGPTSLALGLQGAGVVAAALGASEGSPLDPAVVTDRVRAALIEHTTPIVGLGQQLAQQAGVRFAGIDLSPAPAGQDSIAAAIEAASVPGAASGWPWPPPSPLPSRPRPCPPAATTGSCCQCWKTPCSDNAGSKATSACIRCCATPPSAARAWMPSRCLATAPPSRSPGSWGTSPRSRCACASHCRHGCSPSLAREPENRPPSPLPT